MSVFSAFLQPRVVSTTHGEKVYLKMFTLYIHQNKFHIPIVTCVNLVLYRTLCAMYSYYKSIYREAIIIYNVMHVYIIHICQVNFLFRSIGSISVDCDQHSPGRYRCQWTHPRPGLVVHGVDCSLVITESGQLLAARNTGGSCL